MINIDNLTRQHDDILEVLLETKEMVSNNEFPNNAQSIAKNINRIAGKLKVHLGNEDRFLYPSFLEGDSEELRQKAHDYLGEMGNLSQVYTEFKDKYNTQQKINNNIGDFKKDYSAVYTAIARRIERENNDLYVVARKL